MVNYTNPYMNGYMIPQQPQQNNSSGLIGVSSEQEARSYPVEPGKSVTFRNESEPKVFYTKTLGSALDTPIFERWRLVKEEIPVQATETPDKKEDIDLSAYALKTDLTAFKDDIEGIKRDIAAIKGRIKL